MEPRRLSMDGGTGKSGPDWVGMVRALSEFPDCDFHEVVVRDGFLAAWTRIEPQYLFAKGRNRRQSAEALLESPNWRAFTNLCRRIRNGRLKLVKIRDGRPIAATGELPWRWFRRRMQRATNLGESDRNYPAAAPVAAATVRAGKSRWQGPS